jgi:hypothetical protein
VGYFEGHSSQHLRDLGLGVSSYADSSISLVTLLESTPVPPGGSFWCDMEEPRAHPCAGILLVNTRRDQARRVSPNIEKELFAAAVTGQAGRGGGGKKGRTGTSAGRARGQCT